jgi:hypothetical protein
MRKIKNINEFISFEIPIEKIPFPDGNFVPLSGDEYSSLFLDRRIGRTIDNRIFSFLKENNIFFEKRNGIDKTFGNSKEEYEEYEIVFITIGEKAFRIIPIKDDYYAVLKIRPLPQTTFLCDQVDGLIYFIKSQMEL